MAREISSLYSFNKGLISRLALGRVDVKRVGLGAQVQTNYIPRVLGPMSLRPGFKYIGATYTNARAKFLKFIFSTTDTALLELTDSIMRVWIGDVLLTRPSVTSAITNGDFTADLSSWTDNDDAGGVSQWVSPGYMELVGDGQHRAIRDQVVTTVETGTEHALRIVIARGPVMLRVGTAAGDDNYIQETTLYEGTHSLAFTPTGNFNIRFFSTLKRKVWVDSCTIESSGVVTVPTPWVDADLNKVRHDQSGDILFVACSGKQQRRIERRGTGRSWSVVLYQSPDGPFKTNNITAATITPSATSGNITLTGSLPIFRSTHVGALFSITSVGQTGTITTAVSGTATPSIRVTGTGTSRQFSITITGDATGSTVDLQQSYDNATWISTGPPNQWTADVATTANDGLNNLIVYFRLILTTRVAPDTVTMSLGITTGSILGIMRVTDYSSATSVSAEVISELGGTTASTVWQEGQWSDANGWPTSVQFHDGRLWWAGKNGIWGSVSDAFDSFDETVVGDSGPINRTIGSGPVDTVNWILSLQRLIIGSQGAEISARASSLDEPLTPTNFGMKATSTQGSGAVPATKIDLQGYFVDRSSIKVYEMAFDIRSYDYISSELTALVPELGSPGIVRMDAQRKPDTRLHCVRSDGAVMVAVLNKTEDQLAWVEIETDGTIEDVVTLPAVSGNTDDQVYYVVNRTINGSTVRYLEKWAQEIDCRGGSSNQQADAFITSTGSVITGLSHLEGKEVVVWGDGIDVGTDDSVTPWVQRYTVSGGQITLASTYTTVVVGLGYTAQFQSTKLGTAQGASPLNIQKRLKHLGLILDYVHPKGLKFGADFDHLDDMPGIEAGTNVGTATVTEYDENLIPFPGVWTTDMRLCLQSQAPRPCTILAATIDDVVNT